MTDTERLERLLLQNVLPFWSRDIVDDRGGYRLNHDSHGRWRGPSPKALVTQTRMVWFFSRLLRSPYAELEYAQVARHGFAFLEAHIRDSQHGGFYWEVDENGSAATDDSKQLYGQAFALYALSEFADALNDAHARAMAEDLFHDLDQKAHDAEFGGYIERFDRQWRAAGPQIKTLNTHLHLLEAITRYYVSTWDEVARERILELISILSSAVVRKHIGACSNAHLRDWRPVLDRAQSFVSYGHDLELCFMLTKACEAIGTPVHPFIDLFHAFAHYALTFGFDKRRGGFYHTGRFNKRANDRTKIWWVQAEALNTMLMLWKLTGEDRYRFAFSRTLDWIERHQADWERGEWHGRIDTRGRITGDKAGPWKGPYHQGRALLECLQVLQSPRLERPG